MSAIDDVAAERERQKAKLGWSEAHDDAHDDGSIARAGAAYALTGAGECVLNGEAWWPWEKEGFKPKNPRADLIRAAALLVAEIERIDRHEKNFAGMVADYKAVHAKGGNP